MIDDALKTRLDHLVEAEVIQGFRVVEVPQTVQIMLQDARKYDPAIPNLAKVRLVKLTPRKRAKVSEAVLGQYHDDLRNDKILSKNKIRELNIARGEWDVAKEKRITELQRSTTKLMQELAVDGIDKEIIWRTNLAVASEGYLKDLQESEKPEGEKEYLRSIFWRWINYSEAQAAEYATYAASQDKDVYSPDADLSKLYDTAPTTTAAEHLATIDDVQYNLERYLRLYTERQELMSLLQEQALMYAQSVETRRENTEEMARMFYGASALDAEENLLGPVTATLDAFWDMPEEFIGWLMEEAYFFYNGIPKAVRAHMDEWGFTTAGRESGLQAPFEESPVPPSSSTATPPQTETPVDSTELPVSKS